MGPNQVDIASRWPAAARPFALAVDDLIRWLRDHRDDPAAAQLGADGATGVGLVAAYPIGAGAGRTAAEAGHAKVGQQVLEDRRVVGLTRRDQHHKRASPPVDEVMDLAGQPAAGAADAVIRRLDARIGVIRPIPLCGE